MVAREKPKRFPPALKFSCQGSKSCAEAFVTVPFPSITAFVIILNGMVDKQWATLSLFMKGHMNVSSYDFVFAKAELKSINVTGVCGKENERC